MNINPHYRSLLIQLSVVLGIPLVVIGGWYFIIRGGADEPESASRAEVIENGAKVREALAIIDRLRFDDTLFAIPAFATLEDQTVRIDEVPLGKQNPFVVPEEMRGPSTPATTSAQRQGGTPVRR